MKKQLCFVRVLLSFSLCAGMAFPCACSRRKERQTSNSTSPLSTFYSTQSQVIDCEHVIDARFWGDEILLQTFNVSDERSEIISEWWVSKQMGQSNAPMPLDSKGNIVTPDNYLIITNPEGEILSQYDLNQEIGFSVDNWRIVKCNDDKVWLLSDVVDEETGKEFYRLDFFSTQTGFTKQSQFDFDLEQCRISDFDIVSEGRVVLYCYGKTDSILVFDERNQLTEEVPLPCTDCGNFVAWNGEITCVGYDTDRNQYMFQYDFVSDKWRQTPIQLGTCYNSVPIDDLLFEMSRGQLSCIESDSISLTTLSLESVSVWGFVSDIRMQTDGKLELLTMPSNGEMVVKYLLDPVDEKPNIEKFVIAGYDLENTVVYSLVEDLSVQHPEVHFVIRDYKGEINTSEEENWKQAQNEIYTIMSLDIASGNSPDMYFDSYDDTGLGELGRLGYLADLSAFVNSLDANDFFIDKLTMGQDVPNCVCLSFDILAFEASKDYVTEVETWTYDDFYTSAERFNDLSCVQTAYSKSHLLEHGVLAQMDSFVKEGNANFQSEDFIKLLTWSNEIGRKTDWDEYVSAELDDGLFMLDWMNISSYLSIFLLDDNHQIVGFPNENGSLHVVPYNVFAISSSCKNMEFAQELLMYAIGEKFQLREATVFDNSVNQKAFEDEFERHYEMLTKENPSDSHHSKSEYYEKYMQVLERADRYLHGYQAIVDICLEEAAGYFAGDISAERAAELIQNRATLYLQETATP